jgi:hypothetical protein
MDKIKQEKLNKAIDKMLEGAPPQTYFWVGESGNWSDEANWATFEDDEKRTPLPSPNSRVVIDDSKFKKTSNKAKKITVTIDKEVTIQELECKNIILELKSNLNLTNCTFTA